MASIRVLMADDHPLIIEGATAALGQGDIAVVGRASSAVDVAAQCAALKPDVLLLDVRFRSGPNGLDIARRLLAQAPEARIVFYSQFDDDEIIREAYRLGGLGFVTKDTSAETLGHAIREAHAGRTSFMPQIAERLALLGVRGETTPQDVLDQREIDVFVKLARGLTNNEIAEEMGLSSKTIGIIGHAIREKLSVDRNADLTLMAVRHGLITP